MLEVFDPAWVATFERDRQDLLAALEMLRVGVCDIPEEGLNRRQAHVARRGSVVTRVLKVVQEGDDGLGGHGIEIQSDHVALGALGDEAQEQGQTVAVTPQGMGTRAADLWQVGGEERAQGRSQRGDGRAAHRWSPPNASVVTQAPATARNRALATSARAGTKGK